jgi:hypothetical protein
MLPERGKGAPYGVYDIAANAGWINLGITRETAALGFKKTGLALEDLRRLDVNGIHARDTNQ